MDYRAVITLDYDGTTDHNDRGVRPSAPWTAALETLLHVLAQLVVGDELGRLRPTRAAFGVPLRDRCLVVQVYVRVEALRRSSREIFDGSRPVRRAISRAPCPWALSIAMSSRSGNDR